MSNTSNLQLPYLAVGQAQKHVTLNQSLRRLDAIIQLSVVSATTAAEPASPVDGAVYIVPAGKSGTHCASFANWSLGYCRDGAWEQITPREGWLAFVGDADQLMHYNGSAWALFAPGKRIAVSAADRLMGRSTAGAGAAEEITCTVAGRALIDDADVAAQRTTLGLGTVATQNTGTSGANVPLLNGANTWSASQTFNVEPLVQGLSAGVNFNETDEATDKKRWRITATGGALQMMARSDDVSVSSNFMTVLRTTTTIDEIELNATTLDFRSNFDLSGTSIFGDVPRPGSDNAVTLGNGSFRWSQVYAGTGTINTSDAREKTELRPVSDSERRAVRRVMADVGVFRGLSAVAEKGEMARLHAGVTAQAVEAAFAAEGLDARSYALFCEDSVGDGEVRLGVRYDQLFAMAFVALCAS